MPLDSSNPRPEFHSAGKTGDDSSARGRASQRDCSSSPRSGSPRHPPLGVQASGPHVERCEAPRLSTKFEPYPADLASRFRAVSPKRRGSRAGRRIHHGSFRPPHGRKAVAAVFPAATLRPPRLSAARACLHPCPAAANQHFSLTLGPRRRPTVPGAGRPVGTAPGGGGPGDAAAPRGVARPGRRGRRRRARRGRRRGAPGGAPGQ